jgi:hypothetical protein
MTLLTSEGFIATKPEASTSLSGPVGAAGESMVEELQRSWESRRTEQPHIRIIIRQCLAVKYFLLCLVFVSIKNVSGYFNEYPPSVRRLPTEIQRTSSLGHLLLLRRGACNLQMAASKDGGDVEANDDGDNGNVSKLVEELLSRVTRLEEFVAKQEVEIYRLKKQCNDLTETTNNFARVIQLLREAGLQADDLGGAKSLKPTEESGDDETGGTKQSRGPKFARMVEAFDDASIFGTAPASVLDAADSAGAAILAAMLGGKQRMLVDVRDAELSLEPESLVEFIELAILPIAAGLEGLTSTRNRVKIVFPKVSQLLEYRRTMALAAPEVVALSTLGFDPVEKRDKLVVIVAPAPDDEDGLRAMAELLAPTDPNLEPIQQPVVILNYHMVPVAGLGVDFETAYHLRLLTVQYMSGDNARGYFQQFEEESDDNDVDSVADIDSGNISNTENEKIPEDAALEAAMKHAHAVGMNQVVTRAMVIRAFPK